MYLSIIFGDILSHIMVEIGLLRVFATVAKLGSVSAAAKALHYVQPNVSARIAQLEETLSTQLFFRKSRGMELTPSGRRLLPHAEKLLGTVEQIHRTFALGNDLSGELRIGTTDTFAAVHLPHVARTVHSALPHLRLSIDTQESATLIEGLLDYRLDAAFIESDATDKALQRHFVREDELVLVTSLERAPGPPGERDAIIAFPRGCRYRSALEEWFSASGIHPRSTQEFRGLDAVLGCTAAGMGITALPRVIAEASRHSVRIVEPTTRLPVVRTYWVHRKDVAEFPAVRALSAVVARPHDPRFTT